MKLIVRCAASKLQMRRGLAIFLILLFGLAPLTAALAASDESRLPPWLPPPRRAPLRNDGSLAGADRLRQTRRRHTIHLPALSRLWPALYRHAGCAGCGSGRAAGSLRAASLHRCPKRRHPADSPPQPRRPWTSRRLSWLKNTFLQGACPICLCCKRGLTEVVP